MHQTSASRATRWEAVHEAVALHYRLMPPAEQALLRRLAVFPGTFTLASAVEVCGASSAPGEVDAQLDDLVRRGLVQLQPDPATTSRTFIIAPLVRIHLIDLLHVSGEADTARDRYAVWLLADATQGAGPEWSDLPLTPREREVLALLASGCSNREIGRRLVITEGTAGLHVKHILHKLGLTSRAQVAAWIARTRGQWSGSEEYPARVSRLGDAGAGRGL